ncbi:ATP-dependent DNA helicase [Reinekea marinisedimentorum]|uniref:DNA 5'-3' helicase n=1 Tax=Reinekea marinisedimentorum TaxID=230495 RepID=A0A4R3ICT3_9GAMM|nr:ATP-dependent DNA helicase [Reinekea marinisedimentorum]TCS43227.1 DNA excision repair protein ERCC-2 [Reinekea marinisedimentorum]
MTSEAVNRKTYRVSVRALAEFNQIQGSLIATDRPGPSALEGQQVHRITQVSRQKHYRAEFPVRLNWACRDFDIQLSGRIDGVFEDGIEEIKSTRVPIEELSDEAKQLNRLQANLYAALYSLSTGHADRICSRLSYVHAQTLKEQTDDQWLSQAEAVDLLTTCCAHYEDWLDKFHRHQHKRAGLLNAMNFPYPQLRVSQRQMAENVYRACRTKRHLCVEAPTGTGKTLAALFPALKAASSQQVQSIYFLTMKTTGQQAATTALEKLDPERELTSVSLGARKRLCLNSESVCDGEYCNYAKDYFKKRQALRHKLFSRNHWSFEQLKTLGTDNEVCPYYLSQDWAIWADIVIGDMNYIYDTTATQPYLLKEINNQAIILIDEGHNLIDRGRMMFSCEFKGEELQMLMARVPAAMKKPLQKIQKQLREYCLNTTVELSDTAPDALVNALRNFNAESAALLRENPSYEPNQLWQEFIFTSARFVRLHELANKEDFTWRVRGGKPAERKIELLCLNPAKLLKQKHCCANNVIAFSATFTPWHFSNQMNGLQAAVTQQLASPFKPEQFRVFIANDVSTRFKDKTALPQALNGTLKRIVSNNRNSMVFFSSYQQLNSCSSELPENEKIIIQQRSLTTEEREALINRFRTETGLTLLTVLGGVFAEGIDLPEEQLSEVVVVGTGLPQLNTVNNEIKQRLLNSGLNGFEFAYLFPGLQKVLQAAGRCVRTEQDYGSILLIDDRFEDYFHRGWLPEHWQVSIGSLKNWD